MLSKMRFLSHIESTSRRENWLQYTMRSASPFPLRMRIALRQLGLCACAGQLVLDSVPVTPSAKTLSCMWKHGRRIILSGGRGGDLNIVA